MINYSLFVTGAYLTSPTNASFNDIEKINASVHVEWDWEDDDGTRDKSSLKAIGAGRDGEGNIYVTFINTGSVMRSPVIYELYWTEKGNPKPEKGGVLLTEGEIPALQTNEEYTIYFTPTLLGNYMFKAYHRPGHPGKGELWSDVISVSFINNIQMQPLIPEVPVGGGGPAAGLPNVEKERKLTDRDLQAIIEEKITQEDLDRYLNGEITREELDELIDREPENEKPDEVPVPQEPIRPEEEEELVSPEEEDKDSKEELGLPDEDREPGMEAPNDRDTEGSDSGVDDGATEGSDSGVDDGATEGSDSGVDDGATEGSESGVDDGATEDSDTAADSGDLPES